MRQAMITISILKTAQSRSVLSLSRQHYCIRNDVFTH
jgi:hypothetical protein